MRVCSLKHRDDERNDPGHIVAEFSGEEMIALNKMVYHATKELHGKSDALELYKSIYLLNALVQHGNLDTEDILILDEIDTRLHQGSQSGAAE
jgi:hypothetical protein